MYMFLKACNEIRRISEKDVFPKRYTIAFKRNGA